MTTEGPIAGSAGGEHAERFTRVAAAAVHDRLRDPRLGNGIRRRAAGQLSALGRRGPRDGAGHQVVSGAAGDPPGAQRAAGQCPQARGLRRPVAARAAAARRSATRRPMSCSPSRCRWPCSCCSRRSVPTSARCSCCARCSASTTTKSPARWANPWRRCARSAHRAREHVQARRKRFEPVDPTQTARDHRTVPHRRGHRRHARRCCRCSRRTPPGPPTAAARRSRPARRSSAPRR